MSMRIMAVSSSNRKAASALVSSVLPTPVGPQEQEGADGPVGILQAGARTPHGIGDGDDRLVLADDPPAQRIFHMEELLALALQHLVDGNAGPARDDGGDLALAHTSFSTR